MLKARHPFNRRIDFSESAPPKQSYLGKRKENTRRGCAVDWMREGSNNEGGDCSQYLIIHVVGIRHQVGPPLDEKERNRKQWKETERKKEN